MRWLRRLGPRPPRAVVLLYHRVASPGVDPWRLAVAPDRFAEHLDVLRRVAWPVPLGRLAAGLRAGRLPRGAVAVTFDDGYADNLHAARPLLARHDVPATVFVTSGALGGRGFWWDVLARVLLGPGALPRTLRLPVGAETRAWDLGDAAAWDAETARRWAAWEPWGEDCPTPRHRAHRELYEALFALDEAARQPALEALRRAGGVGAAAGDAERPLTREEAATLVRDGLVELGCHTRTHPSLARLGAAAQAAEVAGARADLAALAPRPVASFAYPFGRREDFTAETTALVRAAGFEDACANFEGVVECATDPYAIPRVQVRDWDGEELARRLAAWLG